MIATKEKNERMKKWKMAGEKNTWIKQNKNDKIKSKSKESVIKDREIRRKWIY